MILLEWNNRILFETIQQRFANSKRELLAVDFADFDGVSFKINTPEENKAIVYISIAWSCIPQLLKYGAKQDLAKVYGPMLQQTPEAGFDITLKIDLDNPTENPENLPQKLSNLKRHVLAAPFKQTFERLAKGERPSEIIPINYRDGESFYIKPESDGRCTVIFSIAFRDAGDAVLAKVFLQEFADARKNMRGVPSVTYNYKEAPLELQGYNGISQKEISSNGFVSFVLFETHLAPNNVFKTINLIQTFRNYLHYHIKCSKAYMHNRMRSRVVAWLQVLNRARPDPIAEKKKKLASGKTFVRK